MNIDWARKLTSRKLWLALALFVSGLAAHWLGDEAAAKIAGDIMQGAAVIAYIVGEGLVDAANKPAAVQAEPQAETVSAIGFEAYNTEGEGL